MRKYTVNALLLVALVLPVVLFLRLLSPLHANVLIAAVIAIAIGWALNVGWAFAAQGDTGKVEPQANKSFSSIAMRFGWACPAVLVLITWLIWRFVLGHAT